MFIHHGSCIFVGAVRNEDFEIFKLGPGSGKGLVFVGFKQMFETVQTWGVGEHVQKLVAKTISEFKNESRRKATANPIAMHCFFIIVLQIIPFILDS